MTFHLQHPHACLFDRGAFTRALHTDCSPMCPTACLCLCAWVQAARADALARQLKRMEGSRASSSSSLNRLRRENDALKGLLLELAADRQAAQARLAELQQKMADLASSSMSAEVGRVRQGGGACGMRHGGRGTRGGAIFSPCPDHQWGRGRGNGVVQLEAGNQVGHGCSSTTPWSGCAAERALM
jgi:hypothetical protein